jgi:hypothetical protein
MTETAVHRTERRSGGGGSGLFVALWIAFFVLMAADPDVLHRLWAWLRGLPLAAEIVMWIVTLPWAVGLAVWETSLVDWLRVLLVVLIALAWSAVFAPKR